jgi:hypothetical protein
VSDLPPTVDLLETGAVALCFAAIFLFGGRVHPLRALGFDRRSLVSFAAGMSAAYVFVHLMPEMHAAREALVESSSQSLRHDGMAVYFLGLAGFLAVYGLERLRAHLRRSASHVDGEVRAFRMHIGGFAAYVFLMSCLLLRGLEAEPTEVGLYAVAIGAHFLALEHSLHEEHGSAWHRRGRWVLATMCLLGWAAGAFLPLSHGLLALLVAFVSGAVIMTSAVMELPDDKDGRFLPFLGGGLLYGLLLLPLA